MPLYFIAIVVPDEVNRQVLEWKNHMLHQFNCKKALRSPAHITLIPPFNMQSALEQPLTVALDAFARQQATFPVYVKNFAAFAPRVIYVQVEPGIPLLQLRENLEFFLLQANRFPIKKDGRPFHPHITIASRDLKESDFTAAWQHFSDRLYEAVFEAGTISLLVHTGNQWKIVADYPFVTRIIKST